MIEKIILVLTYSIIGFEILKMFFGKAIWDIVVYSYQNQIKNKDINNNLLSNNPDREIIVNKYLLLISKIFHYIYLSYIAILLFTPYWYIGILLLVITIINAVILFKNIINKHVYNQRLFFIFLIDNIITILLLSIMI